jgi:hypothetical protein
VKGEEVVSCWDCVKKGLSRDCEKTNIIDPQHIIHWSVAGYDSALRKHTLQTYQDESDLNVHLVQEHKATLHTTVHQVDSERNL